MDDTQAQMLQALAQDPGAARTLLQSMLAERAASDPSIGALMQLVSARADSTAEMPAEEGPDPRRRARVQRIRERVQEMREELVELHQRNEDLAAALGACPVCWGRSAACEECGGDGSPGWLAPDRALFEEFVAPVIARMRRAPGRETSNGRKQ